MARKSMTSYLFDDRLYHKNPTLPLVCVFCGELSPYEWLGKGICASCKQAINDIPNDK